MSNPSKRRGSQFEKDVVEYLQEWLGPEVHRRTTEGVNDRGDIGGVRGWVLECKATQAITLSTFFKELKAELNNADKRGGDPHSGAVIIKRRMGHVEDHYVVMDLATFRKVLLMLEGAP